MTIDNRTAAVTDEQVQEALDEIVHQLVERYQPEQILPTERRFPHS